jgi:hypothetical protein
VCVWSGAVAVLQIRNWMAAASSGRRRKEIRRSWPNDGPKRQIVIIIIIIIIIIIERGGGRICWIAGRSYLKLDFLLSIVLFSTFLPFLFFL